MPRAIDRLLEKGKEEEREPVRYGQTLTLTHYGGIALFKSCFSREVLLNMNRGSDGEIWTISFDGGKPQLMAAYLGDYAEEALHHPSVKTLIYNGGDFTGNSPHSVVNFMMDGSEEYEQRQAELLEIFKRMKEERNQ